VERNKYIVEHFKKTGKIPKLTGFRFEDPFQTAFKISPERAIEWLKTRGKNLKLSIDWDELDSEAHDKAFTVAKVLNADILQLIYDFIETAKNEGWTFKEFKERLIEKLEQTGWSGLTPSRLKVIYDTNIQMSYSQGKYKQQKLISNIYPFWKYTQKERPTKRHDHSRFHNKVFRHDDPIWKKIYPPSGFGCKCSVVPIKDNSRMETGNTYLPDIENSKDFQLSPLKAWEPQVENYVEGIRTKLKEMLKN
jgi:SPP1 gp7 family putative phage head morphogenesis protein